MPEHQVDPNNVLAIILGASEFPKTTLLPAPSFRKSAEDFRDYLISPDFFNLPKENLLYLFDCTDPGPVIDENICKFLQQKISKSQNSAQKVTDVLFYYVGHGGFANGGADYYLTLADTRTHSELISSYPINGLANTLKNNSRNIRRYVILDCCFAGAAVQAFMSGGAGAIAGQMASQAFVEPQKGTALLCASSSQKPAMAPPGEFHTMFSGALLEILQSNTDSSKAYLSMKDLHHLIESRLRDKYESEAVRPEIHDPNQTVGIVGDIPIFPNPYVRKKIQQQRIDEIESSISLLLSQQRSIQQSVASIQAAVGELQKVQQSGTVSRETSKISLPAKRRSRFVGFFRVYEEDWNSIPVPIKRRINTMNSLLLTTLVWAMLCCLMFYFVWFGGKYIQSRFYDLLFIIGQLVIAVVAVIGLIRPEQHRLSAPLTELKEDRWMHLDVVLALDRVNACQVMPHFFVDRMVLSISTLFLAPSALLSLYLAFTRGV